MAIENFRDLLAKNRAGELAERVVMHEHVENVPDGVYETGDPAKDSARAAYMENESRYDIPGDDAFDAGWDAAMKHSNA